MIAMIMTLLKIIIIIIIPNDDDNDNYSNKNNGNNSNKNNKLRVGLRGGCEAAAHACCRYVTFLLKGEDVAKLNFINSSSFRPINRDAMLDAVFT